MEEEDVDDGKEKDEVEDELLLCEASDFLEQVPNESSARASVVVINIFFMILGV
ncbi:hypothetical protein [Lactococcus lactis]|uniref:hypothetical protein n=1 Tax=Lactococcus lactis TaxID=1358 RepID=UPI002074A045|nr:hypothetical protein [Lactococcus lactis]